MTSPSPLLPSPSTPASGPSAPRAGSRAYSRVLDSITSASATLGTVPTPADHRITLQDVAALSADEWHRLSEAGGSVLADHDLISHRLKLRVIPGVIHNLAAGTLLINLDNAFTELGLRGKVQDLGSRRLPITATRSKEADGALTPESRLVRGLNIPSFIVDVGISESPALLTEDAKDWLLSDRTSEWVRGALTVTVEPDPGRQESCQITMRLHTKRQRFLRSNPSTRRQKIEWEIVWRSDQPWPEPLRLPARYFLDLLQWPEGLPEDATVEVNAQKMTQWAETLASVWQAEVVGRSRGSAAQSQSSS